jgi:hypothetical protein
VVPEPDVLPVVEVLVSVVAELVVPPVVAVLVLLEAPVVVAELALPEPSTGSPG